MIKIRIIFAIIALSASCGCATQAKILQRKQATAVQKAVDRGKFDLDCPAATGVVISQEMIQPAIQGPRFGGIHRAEYTIGVQGCGKRQTYIVICPEGGEVCFAASPGEFHDWQKK